MGQFEGGTKLQVRKRKVQPHRKNRFTKKPCDIDALLGWEVYGSFEKMEAFFEKHSTKREPSSPLSGSENKKRRIESQKIWISELKVARFFIHGNFEIKLCFQDIDKIYKASELRDIKMTAAS